MRTIPAGDIAAAVCRVFLKASYDIGDDIREAVACAVDSEPSPLGRETLLQILQNQKIATNEQVALCQDTGMAVVFVELGQDVHVVDGDFTEAVHVGVRKAYSEGYLRKSIVTDPLFERVNTGDNTPAVVHIDLVPGENIRLTACPKGFGSENMSRVYMLSPSAGVEGVIRCAVECVETAGANPCPPVIVGMGIGGTMEKAALLSKKALLRTVGTPHPDPAYAQLEHEIVTRLNRLGIGPAGTGGRTTCLSVAIEHFPTHIAGLPVAINLCCHASRHAEEVL